MTDEAYEQWEARVLDRNRYDSEEEYRRNVVRWIRHMEPTCERLRQQLADPYLAQQHEYFQQCLDSHLAWQAGLIKRFKP